MKFILALSLAALLASASAARPQTAPQASGADEAEAARLSSEVVKLYNAGRHDEALPLARRAVELSEKAHGADHPALASQLYNLGAVLLEKKENGEAERVFRRAVGLAEKGTPPNARLLGNLYGHLASLRTRADDFAQAESLYLRAVEFKGQAGADLLPEIIYLIEVQLARRGFDRAAASLERLNASLRARPRKDEAAADRMKSYLCPLFGAKQSEAARQVQEAISRLRDPEEAAERDRTRVLSPASEGVLNGRVTRSVAPDYPAAAKAQRASGTVVVALTVSGEGRVLEAEAICGHPQLLGAAVEAVRQWRFSPTLLNGQPVKVTGTVTVNFVLR